MQCYLIATTELHTCADCDTSPFSHQSSQTHQIMFQIKLQVTCQISQFKQKHLVNNDNRFNIKSNNQPPESCQTVYAKSNPKQHMESRPIHVRICTVLVVPDVLMSHDLFETSLHVSVIKLCVLCIHIYVV